MRVIIPVTIDDAKFLSSSVPETDAPVWSAATNYAADVLVMRNHKVWKSAQPANLNHTPESSPLWWTDMGSTNRWAAFDNKVGSVVTGTTPMTFVLKPGQIQSLALLNVNAETVQVILKDEVGGTVVYDETQSFVSEGVIDSWFDYFYTPFSRKTDGVFTNIPPYAQGELTVILSNPINDVSVGTIIVGTGTQLGQSQWGARVGITDYSRKETDTFGNFIVVERAFSKRMSVDVVVNASYVDTVVSLLAQHRATPLLWVGADTMYTCLIVYGFYKSFDVNISYFSDSICSLEIEGLT